MKIVIDARMYQESGVGRYIRNLIKKLQEIDKVNEYYVLHLKDEYDSLIYQKKNFKKVLVDFKWYGVSEQIKLPRILNDINPDLVHFPHFNTPILYRGKFIVTIHDLIHQHFQMRRATTLNPITYKLKQFAYKKVFNNAIFKSQKILVPSNYVKDLLVKKWGVAGNKIIVTYEAVDEGLVSIANNLSQKKSKEILGKFNIKSPYLFYVGNAHPHKNVEGLIKTFLFLQKKYPNLNLVLSGHDHYFWERVKKENHNAGIFYTGFIIDEELVALYKNALCFVMPSLEEGFGIPLLEAMACSCPVVSSKGGALPEIGEDAVIYFDPKDKGDMENKIDQVLNSDKLKKALVEKGKKRYRQFNWEELSRKTLEEYLKCV